MAQYWHDNIGKVDPGGTMVTTNELPYPNEAELAHTTKMARFLVSYIQEKGGQISFADFFEQALYHKEYGYYTGALPIFGTEGDFITAPLVSPFFSYGLANQVIEVAENLGGVYDILEIGAGSGVMAADVLTHLKKHDCLPQKYLILERSPHLKGEQHAHLLKTHPDLIDRIEWIDEAPSENWRGVLLANEVIDALPVERFRFENGKPYYVDVALNIDQANESVSLTPTLRESDEALNQFIAELAEYEITFNDGFESEYCPLLHDWLPEVTKTLTEGVALFIDYGYDEAEYYRPERKTGTLIAHYKHHAHEDFYLYPGLQDLTANVNFTQVAMIAEAAGMDVLGYTTQNFFLFGNQLEALLTEAKANTPDEVEWYRISQGVQEVVLPNAMGERFKVMALGRNYEHDLQGFSLAEYSYQL
ncbi:SAM-dependent methyltransferase [Ignatzschineria sp. RMDPL8A]|uniref:class I SAM-dependent methyltransferase n=1 Tax=Ignatzschineria sp. RMDPL8A TaxID=2999236 RepID=UPI0024466D48|nr:SAM-dependent methyltransferase [Ignatzschineria sp. RMDPL8A]MDG9729723.1 SAM-dependent methyltransferase [Ignatzschineria sp. RMDPL8A]